MDPIVPFTDAEQVASIREFYGLAPGLKLEEKLISRSQSDDRKPKRLYYISKGALHLSVQKVARAACWVSCSLVDCSPIDRLPLKCLAAHVTMFG